MFNAAFVWVLETNTMPRNYQRETTAATHTTELINTAGHDVSINKRLVSEVSRLLGISRPSLIRYFKTDDESKTLGHNRIFTKKEKVSCQYISHCSKMVHHKLTWEKSYELAYRYAVNLNKNVALSWAIKGSGGNTGWTLFVNKSQK